MKPIVNLSSLLVIVKSHLFPQFIQLNQEISKAAAVTAMGTGERGEVVSQSRWVGTWRERRGGNSQSIAVDVGRHSGERQGGSAAAVTHARSGHLGGRTAAFTHNRRLVEAPD